MQKLGLQLQRRSLLRNSPSFVLPFNLFFFYRQYIVKKNKFIVCVCKYKNSLYTCKYVSEIVCVCARLYRSERGHEYEYHKCMLIVTRKEFSKLNHYSIEVCIIPISEIGRRQFIHSAEGGGDVSSCVCVCVCVCSFMCTSRRNYNEREVVVRCWVNIYIYPMSQYADCDTSMWNSIIVALKSLFVFRLIIVRLIHHRFLIFVDRE